MHCKFNTGLIQERCNFPKCLIVIFVWFIHTVTKILKSLHLNVSCVFHHVTENGVQNCISMSPVISLYYRIWQYLQLLLHSHMTEMSIGAIAKHVQQLVVVFTNLCQQQFYHIQEQHKAVTGVELLYRGSILYPLSTDISYGRMNTVRIPWLQILTKFHTAFYSYYCCHSLLH